MSSTEQHGYQLPLATDAILATELALAVAEPLAFLVAPVVAYDENRPPGIATNGRNYRGDRTKTGPKRSGLLVGRQRDCSC